MNERILIGSRALWLMVRIATAFLLWALTVFFLELLSSPFESDLIFAIAAGLNALVVVYPVAIGWANQDGIHVRQFIFSRSVPWDNVEKILWTTGSAFVFPRQGSCLRGKLRFFLGGTNFQEAMEE